MSSEAFLICTTCKEKIHIGNRKGVYETAIEDLSLFLRDHVTSELKEHNLIFWKEDAYDPIPGLKEIEFTKK